MKITRAQIKDLDTIGAVHSLAWKQAYADIFPAEFLEADSPKARAEEFRESLECNNIHYYLVYEEEVAVGVVKVKVEGGICEICSIYLLAEHRSRGYGSQIMTQLRQIYAEEEMVLWVLEVNIKARCFYENNGFVLTGRSREISRGRQYIQLEYERATRF